ncbi:MAG TPA: S1 RNA-binding domain-containing protein [Vicinamibacterales bacterium]|nr:S1 RNA-binding domain-containing protein [Vicinamibacterales bacterium]
MSEPDEDFAALFEASLKQKRIERGQTIEGTIVAIGPEVAFVNVGGKGEAMIALDELKNADGVLEVAVGDRIQAVVVSTEGGLKLSRKLARAAATDRQIEDAFRAGLPVEGKVERAVKGGYEVRVGHQRAFCPISQIDARRDTDPAEHIGRLYTFRILEYREGGRNLVVSRRALVEEEQRASAADFRRSLAVGAVLTGRVASVRDFGAFVELGAGVQGLLPVSEMSWSRVPSASAVVAAGDQITVKVLRVDDDGQKITLGLKQLSDDPWSKVPTAYAVGQVREGRVTRLAEFGAFVELEPGIEGLAHVSTFPPGHAGAWRRLAPVGATGMFEIVSVDLATKRIGLAPVQGGSRGAAREADDVREYAERQGAEQAAEAFGSLADKLRDAIKPRK